MKIYTEKSLEEFEFWSGAKDTVQRINEWDGNWNAIEAVLSDLYPEGIDKTQLNDIFWFEPENVFEWAGVPDDDALKAKMTIEDWENQNPEYVDYIKLQYCSDYDEDDFTTWQDMADYLDDDEIYREFLESENEEEE